MITSQEAKLLSDGNQDEQIAMYEYVLKEAETKIRQASAKGKYSCVLAHDEVLYNQRQVSQQALNKLHNTLMGLDYHIGWDYDYTETRINWGKI